MNTMTKGGDEYLTPPYILRALGPFELDPCAPSGREWSDVASRSFTKEVDGLSQEWIGRVWLNPPYGRFTGDWIQKLAEHGNGIALIFARTDVDFFHRYVFEKAEAILFLRGRIHFHNINGKPYLHNAGAPSCLIAYGRRNISALEKCGISGRLVYLK